MLYVILGETCSGKSSTALKVCKENSLPLISADAFGVYQGFDIGSAKSTPKELEGIENYFIDSIPWGQAMTVFEFQTNGRQIINSFKDRNVDGVIVGGTFLYTKALLFPYYFPKEENTGPVIKEYPPLNEMLKTIKELDPESLNLIDTKNPRRVERAYDLAKSGNKREDIESMYSNLPLYPCIFIRLKVDKDQLRSKIKERVLIQVKDGLFEEEERLEKANPEFSSTFRGIGFKEIYQGKREGWTKEKIINQVMVDTIQYARRQRTFLRHQFPYMVEVDKSDIPSLIKTDIEIRNGMESLEVPLINSTPNLMNSIESIYSKGIRQCGIYGDYDENKIHSLYPLLQIVGVTDLNSKGKKDIKFSSKIDF